MVKVRREFLVLQRTTLRLVVQCMALVQPLLGTILNETEAAVIGLPLSHSGQPWEYRRAGLSYSLASELRMVMSLLLVRYECGDSVATNLFQPPHVRKMWGNQPPYVQGR